MRFETAWKNGKRIRTSYVCSSWLKRKQCSRRRLDFYHVDSRIRKALHQEIRLADIAGQRIENGDLPASYHDTLRDYQEQRTQLIGEIRADADSFRSLRKAFLCGELDMDQYRVEKQRLAGRTGRLGQELMEASAASQAHQALFTPHNPWIALYQEQAVHGQLSRQQAKALIERVLVSPDGEITVTFRHQEQKESIRDILEG